MRKIFFSLTYANLFYADGRPFYLLRQFKVALSIDCSYKVIVNLNGECRGFNLPYISQKTFIFLKVLTSVGEF